MVRVRVPASSANLGPGFDSLGLALGLYLSCEIEVAGALRITGCPPAYQGPDNLLYQAYLQASKQLGCTAPALRIHIQSDIPVSRGMGSSAALLLAGVAAAYALHGAATDRDGIFQLAAAMEGHPDNVAAACHGGLTAAMVQDGRYYWAGYPMSDQLHLTALVPGFESLTKQSRASLPKQVSLQDAAHNQAHSLLLLRAIAQGDIALLRSCLQDRWHQPYRLPHIQDGQGVWAMAEALEACVYLSGAGPTIMCLHRGEALFHSLREALAERYPSWQAMALQPDRQGLLVL